VFLTDAAIGRELRVGERGRWLDRLERTRYLSRWSEPVICGPLVRAANSQHLDRVCGRDWLAAGDAAMALDPLAGQGIVAALRSGIFAGYAAGDWLTCGDKQALARYRRFMGVALASHRRARRRYYSLERRWPERPFWQWMFWASENGAADRRGP
jgi:flavin-dependent dehydrogenase